MSRLPLDIALASEKKSTREQIGNFGYGNGTSTSGNLFGTTQQIGNFAYCMRLHGCGGERCLGNDISSNDRPYGTVNCASYG